MAQRSSTTLTSRGVGMTAAGIVTVVLGVGFAAPPLVLVGATMLVTVAVATAWLVGARAIFAKRFPLSRREVQPLPLTVGRPGTVTVTISSTPKGAFGRVVGALAASALDIREQAAAELTGGMGTKATVTRSHQRLALAYRLHPAKRGRWPLGPALVHSADPLGIIWSDTEVGGVQTVPVWPQTVDLAGAAGALMGVADRVVLGARTPSPDDAALRDYHEGDDLRRVHWPSSARRGTMLVRSDERAGRRPATVLLGNAASDGALEWSISAAASIAISVLEAGHPVRLLGAGMPAGRSARAASHRAGVGRSDLLNRTLDIRPASAAASSEQLRRAAVEAAEDLTHGEVIIGVFGPEAQLCADALGPLAVAGRAWALLRHEGDGADAAQAAKTLAALGWRITTVPVGHDLEQAWTTLISASELS